MAGMHRIKTLIIAICLILAGCSDPVLEQIAKQTPISEQRVAQLASALEQGQVRNAKLIRTYSQKLRQSKPELSDLIDEFEKDATTQGPMYKALLDRLNTVKNQPQMFSSNQAIYEELLNIYQAADPVLYSDALSDPLNVLADMSDGQLPRVNALSKAQSLQANNAQDFGVGEQLIGNPNYGQWQTGSNGMSFWAWYGMYAMMDNLFDYRRKRIYYNDWGRYRNYSYYNDYGRTRYSSPSQLRKQTDLDTRTRKSFASKGQKFTSAYSKSRTGSSSLSGQSKSAQSSAKRFASSSRKSSFAKKSSYSKSASFRNSRNTTSRSFRRGK
ncbi:hypothetical protein [Thalassotalea sp. G2M2-11]|uniref:hypothetical protein n=1 Tax=Thalassotalea sp. G2M2-11 TaxID=2787627 RepID=UPI0019D20322|nr:hypothetical protein [Thalassotalea sp. G2M2-11]